MIRNMIGLLASAAMLTAPLPALADSASNLRDLLGARAAGAEQDLQSRGFVLTDGHKGENASFTYWWNPSASDCVMVRTQDGRYAAITDVSAADCRQQNHHGSTSTVIAAGAIGALIGAAILAHKSGHHDDGEHETDAAREADYERGFRDGLHGQAQSGNRNESYRSGYANGVEQRSHETTYEPIADGAASFDPDSLVGARAAGVDTELRSNGFRDVDRFASGSTGSGVVWWNGQTRQCLQVITVDGRADSVTDIGTHPRCR